MIEVLGARVHGAAAEYLQAETENEHEAKTLSDMSPWLN